MLADIASHSVSPLSSPTTPTEYELPSWTGLVILFDLVLFLPLFVFASYTVSAMFPVLAMIEDENPPAYESLATATATDETFARVGVFAEASLQNLAKTDGSPRAVTSSLRMTARLVRAQSGRPRSYFRGISVFFCSAVAFALLRGIFSAMLPPVLAPAAVALGSLALVQFSTAWVHIVITPQSPLPFWRRLPPFRRTFEATFRPTLLAIAVHLIGMLLPALAVTMLDIHVPAPGHSPPTDLAWKGIILALTVLIQVYIIVPAGVVLTRIQASLLPPDQETIVPFDRTFNGRVEPEVVTGRGYATMTDAWKTFSCSAWRRLVILYAKAFAVTMACWLLVVAVVIPEIILVVANSTEKKN